jgi:hypothetical protein
MKKEDDHMEVRHMNAIQEAIIKINTEMQVKPDDLYLEAIGQHVIDHCGNVAAAEAVLKKGKTLKGAMDKVMEAAKVRKQGSVAVMRDDEVYAIVDRYFGIDSMEPVTPLPASEPQSRKIVNVDFGDFF